MYNLTDMIRINDRNLADYDITDLLQGAPFLAALAADIASNGTQHKYLKEITAPTVGFRAINAGRPHSKSVDELVTIDLKVLDAGFSVDKAAADIYQHGTEAFLDREGMRHLRAAFFHAEKQIINGDDAAGFVGMAEADGLSDLSDEMVLGAGGSTALSSVWMVRTTPDFRDAAVIIGQKGKIEWGESTVQRLESAVANNYYFGYVTPIQGWLGMQIGSRYSVARYANLSTTEGHTLNDTKLSKLLELFPVDRQPTHIVMNRRSRGQLQRSRTATNQTGAPAPRPIDYEGIPIIVTEAITNSETAVTASGTTTTTTTTSGG